MSPSITLVHDGIAHHPLGAGSYIFQKNLVQHLIQHCPKSTIKLHVGAQPNSSPHMGTLVAFAVAFCLAKRIREVSEVSDMPRNVQICFTIVDTAPSKLSTVDGVKYQRSQRHTGEMNAYTADFTKAMECFHEYSGISWFMRTQEAFISHPHALVAVRQILERREEYAKSLSPETACLGIRAACPEEGCGLADKHGVSNMYAADFITFHCPSHGPHVVDTTSIEGISKLEFNTPLRNILRALVFFSDEDASWIQVTGSDYAGYYQEQLLWRHIPNTPLLVFYTPLIVDWSGAKLSKSLYVQKGSYQYLKEKKLGYLLSYKEFQEQGKDLRVLYDEVSDWVEHPFKLFRSYSVEYMANLFSNAGTKNTRCLIM